ncbi:MFS transporter [Brachybacterium squillarum]|uniref:MFS transporter n=1 Tax=Brachybacterium squillarum TaxID=661979 RepID=UPI002221EDC7|nr:MFS transporter [Brachybacterium squillarum]MCW1805117.1 MFS transporter [Brachybacterium squillarum]
MSTQNVRSTRPDGTTRKIKNFRYIVLGWLLLAGVLNYMDRTSVSIAAPHMIEDLGLTKTDIGLMGAVFSWTYAFCQLPAGYLIDKIGPRRVYFIAMGLWSIATALMSIGHNLGHFLFFRFLLGVGESPNSPNSSKITTQWFPREERGQAAGIWDSGSKWGSAIAPPVLTLLTLGFGWRAMFLIVGLAGVVLAAAFWAFYRSPEHSKHLSEEEYRYILAGRDDEETAGVKLPWLRFFTYPQTWGMMLGFFSSIWIWNIFITFLPLFLQDTLGVSIVATGWVAAVPYLAAAMGAILAGRVTVVLARRYGMTSIRSKKTILVSGCIALGVLLCIVPFIHSLAFALLVLSLALAVVAAIQSQSWAMSSDVVPDSHAARFGGIMNFGGYFGGALAPVVTGIVVDTTGSYTPSFLLAGVIAALGGLCFAFLVRKPVHADA